MKNIFYFLTLAVLFVACEGEEREITTVIDPIINPPTELITGSVSGTVVDTEGTAVVDAAVSYRGTTIATDDRGRFSFSNTQLFEDGTYVTVSKSGYFKGSRKFYATENNKSNIHIELIERNLSGDIAAGSGGTIEVETASVELPSGSYLTANGQAYNGTVNVFATYLNPADEATFDQMPGDLSGITTENELRGLITFGMVAVELEDASGNPLQLPAGQKATLNMPVPSELQSAAPATIPLWYFDEQNGTWIEEGEAQLINGEYIGEVAHFTFWNCDVPYNFIELSGILEVNRVGVENFRIKITDTSSGLCGVTYTSSNGLFSIKVPKDQNLTMEIVGDCGSIGDLINLGPYSDDAYEGVVTANVELAEFNLIGEITACDGSVSDFSYLEVTNDLGIVSTFPSEDDGSFFVDFDNCEADDNAISVRAVDIVSETASASVDVEVGGEVDLGTLVACEANTFDYGILLVYEGQDWPIGTGVDSTIIGTYSIQIFDLGNGQNKYNYEVTLLNWLTAETASGNFVFTDGDATADYTFSTAQGFDFAGSCSYSVDPIVNFTGISTDITVTDASIYPGNVEEVFFNFKF